MTELSKEEKETKVKTLLQKGYIEAFFDFHSENKISAKDLHSVAEKAECHNTGWPIGVTLTRTDGAPYSINNGIEADIISRYDNSYDFWAINKNGNFYFVRTYQEDEKPIITKKGNAILWFDIRIWRIAELFLYCLRLGKELGIDPSVKIDIAISHFGIKDRVLSCWNQMIMWFDDDNYICKTEPHEFRLSESLDYINLNYKELVHKAVSDLLFYFSKFEISRGDCDQTVDSFLKARS